MGQPFRWLNPGGGQIGRPGYRAGVIPLTPGIFAELEGSEWVERTELPPYRSATGNADGTRYPFMVPLDGGPGMDTIMKHGCRTRKWRIEPALTLNFKQAETVTLGSAHSAHPFFDFADVDDSGTEDPPNRLREPGGDITWGVENTQPGGEFGVPPPGAIRSFQLYNTSGWLIGEGPVVDAVMVYHLSVSVGRFLRALGNQFYAEASVEFRCQVGKLDGEGLTKYFEVLDEFGDPVPAPMSDVIVSNWRTSEGITDPVRNAGACVLRDFEGSEYGSATLGSPSPALPVPNLLASLSIEVRQHEIHGAHPEL